MPFDSVAAWLLAVHIMAFAAWMAAMWYLPRLMVYHCASGAGSAQSETFKVMERRLLRAIGTPALVATWVLGLGLASVQGQWSEGWLHVKLLLVILLTACHGLLARHVRLLATDQRPRSERWYRIVNEIPTVLFIAIVVVVIFKPFT